MSFDTSSSAGESGRIMAARGEAHKQRSGGLKAEGTKKKKGPGQGGRERPGPFTNRLLDGVY